MKLSYDLINHHTHPNIMCHQMGHFRLYPQTLGPSNASPLSFCMAVEINVDFDRKSRARQAPFKHG